MLEPLTDVVTDSPLTYAVVAGLVAFDAVLPIAPSETLVVAAGVLAANGDLFLPAVAAAAATGALAGHSILYLLGRRAGSPIRQRMFRTARARSRVDWAEAVLRERTWLLIVSDFLPGGRTAAMFAAGALGLPAPRFYAFVGPGAVLWAWFYSLLGSRVARPSRPTGRPSRRRSAPRSCLRPSPSWCIGFDGESDLAPTRDRGEVRTRFSGLRPVGVVTLRS